MSDSRRGDDHLLAVALLLAFVLVLAASNTRMLDLFEIAGVAIEHS